MSHLFLKESLASPVNRGTSHLPYSSVSRRQRRQKRGKKEYSVRIRDLNLFFNNSKILFFLGRVFSVKKLY